MFFNHVFQDFKLTNSFHWLVHLDKENDMNEPEIQDKYEQLYEEFLDIMARDYPEYYKNIDMQLEFRKQTVKTALEIRYLDAKNDGQVERLRAIVKGGTEQDLTNLNGGQGVPLSANPDIILAGVRAEKTKVATSATKPLILPFYYRMKDQTEICKDTFTMMFKTGDDMRQDALVLQIFSIMDNILANAGLNMNFTIYNLIAMTKDDGLLQFVPNSKTIYDILNKEEKSIEKYLRNNAKDEKDYERILNNYITTCAGYCSATYLLAIGDRHLENLMITEDGKLFHIDFGFVFGREPNSLKQRLSSKIRISKDMV